MISYVKHGDIDKEKWDDCIRHAANSLIYGCYFYLDVMADQWDAIIVNDYEAVMPLVWRKKYFIKYLYQPPFTQQLGIFFKQPLDESVYGQVAALLYTRFPFAEIYLNCNNAGFEPGNCTPRVNYVLDINKPYQNICDGYLPGFTKSLRRIAKFNFTYCHSDNVEEVLSLYRQLYGSRVRHISDKDYAAFKTVCGILQQRQQLVIRKVPAENGSPHAIVLLYKDDKRLYNIISCVTEEGKRMEVNYFLYDSIIKECCNSGRVLDLEGSDIKGVADFYSKMNPVNEPYNFFRYNHLHPLLRLIKK